MNVQEQKTILLVEDEIVIARAMLISKSPILDKNGAVTGLVAINRDITGSKRVECQREAALDALQKATDRLSMAARAGNVGIWDYDIVNNRLVWDDGMFRLYGITSDNFSGAYEAWQAGVHPDDRQRGDEEVQLALRGDPGRLRQILTNLTGNAIKFTPAGEVAVRVSLVEKTENDVFLRFSVRDTGIGIPKDKISLLFEKFSQVDASTTRQYGGTGLGLAISEQLAALMGGKIGVESEEGKGSEFWFTALLGRQVEGGKAESRSPASLRGVRALIVDDNTTSREILNTRMAGLETEFYRLKHAMTEVL
jgi:signal transduction histidine kinase